MQARVPWLPFQKGAKNKRARQPQAAVQQKGSQLAKPNHGQRNCAERRQQMERATGGAVENGKSMLELKWTFLVGRRGIVQVFSRDGVEHLEDSIQCCGNRRYSRAGMQSEV